MKQSQFMEDLLYQHRWYGISAAARVDDIHILFWGPQSDPSLHSPPNRACIHHGSISTLEPRIWLHTNTELSQNVYQISPAQHFFTSDLLKHQLAKNRNKFKKEKDKQTQLKHEVGNGQLLTRNISEKLQ